MNVETENRNATAVGFDLRVTCPSSSAELKQKLDSLRNELDAALDRGDIDAVLQLEGTLKHLPSLIKAATAKESRERLNAIASELSELATDQTMLEALRGEKNRIVARTIEKLEEEKISVAKVEASQFGVDVRRQNLLDERRDLNRKLEDLKSNFSDSNAEHKIGNNNNLENYFERF